jgi:hypothetical protein
MKKILIGTLIVVAGLFMFSASSVFAQLPCTADFDCTQTVDADDVTEFLTQFGRSPFNDPCPDCYDSPCPCSTQGCDPPAPVEKTGQTTSYATGDDGELERGVAWPNPRFTDNLDGTITDNLTGLIWLKDANCFGQRTWNEALTDCNGLASGSCGVTDSSSAGDWRLSNVKELFSLVDFENISPALPSGHPFNNVQSDYYWSSTSIAGNVSEHAWAVWMVAGTAAYDNKPNIHDVWPVRGGQ